MASTVTWDPNRYGSTKKVLSYNASTGNYSIADQDHSYTGINYNFAALPAAGTTTSTTTGTTTGTTNTTQTTEAFGDVKPWWWNQQGEGDSSGGVFTGYQEKEPVTELTGFFDPLGKAMEGQKPPLGDRLRHQFADLTGKTEREWADVDRALAGETEQPSKFKKTISDFGSAIKTKTKSLLDKIPVMPGMTALQAVNKVLRPGANKSFRNIAGLYNTEINLMRRYGSVGVTDMNPQGDPRKDDAGFNIVSMSGNYNKIGTNSRRHNMLKEADIHEKGSKEWRDARNEIRKDFEEEKKSGNENKNYNIDSSGSADSAPAKAKTTLVVARSAPSQHREGGGEHGGSTRGDQSRDPTGGSPF